MPDTDPLRKPAPSPPPGQPPEGDEKKPPSASPIERPDGRSLLERMKRVDPGLARRYRQKNGQ